MGLAAAYQARLAGHEVSVYEAAPQAGGMAAHFMLGDISIERFYHFLCKTDAPIFELLGELGIADAVHWVRTSMGFFVGGKLHPWGDPISLLRFPHLSLVQKFRYALLIFVATRRHRWDSLEQEDARSWITRWCGAEVYDRMWRKLFEQKFYDMADHVSAAWIWTRIRRVGRSRRSLMQEELGYLTGGSETLVAALVSRIIALGGVVNLATPVSRIQAQDGRVTGLMIADASVAADAVICTVPTPYVGALIANLPREMRAPYEAIENTGVVCVVLHLARSVTPHFWVNINDEAIRVPGIIEFSNLRPLNGHLVYVPYYMPPSRPEWAWEDTRFIEDAMACLTRVNPALKRHDLIGTHVGRLRHAQPICTPGFASLLPAVQTPIAGLQIADTCFYYPEDRGLAESIRLGRAMGRQILAVSGDDRGSCKKAGGDVPYPPDPASFV